MRVIRRMGEAALAIGLLLGATAAHGDGWCEKGFRDTTTAERAAATAVLDAVRAALPAAPTGWVAGTEGVNAPPASLCADQENVPWTYGVTRYFQRTDDQEARSKVMTDAAAEMNAAMAAKQPRLEAVMAKMAALGQEAGAAAQKSDWARVEELNKDSEKLSEEYKQILEEGGSDEKMQAAVAAASLDTTITISARVNSGVESVGESPAGFPAPAGTASAYRWSETHGDTKEDNVLVLLGSWQPPSEGSVQAVSNATAPAPAAQAISVRVAAAATRIEEVVGTIDFEKMAACLSK